MKAVRFAMALAVVVAIAAFVVAQEKQKPWFDMEKCAMCTTMSSKPGLLENLTWEHYKVSNGLMSITVCPEEYNATFEKAMTEMQAVGAKMKAGEKVHLDGFCTTYGELSMAGAKVENIETSVGSISMMTSSDPKVIKKIHEFGQRTIDELAKMEAAAASEEE